MSISAFLKAIEADITPPLQALGARDIATSPGRFDAGEIDRRSFKSPALRVAFLGAGRSKPLPDKTRRYDASWGVFILTDGRGRAAEGLDLMVAIAERIEVNRFAAAAPVGLPENIRLDPLYSASTDDKGIALFSVSWNQSIRLGDAVSLDGADDPTAIPPEGIALQTDITHLPEGT